MEILKYSAILGNTYVLVLYRSSSSKRTDRKTKYLNFKNLLIPFFEKNINQTLTQEKAVIYYIPTIDKHQTWCFGLLDPCCGVYAAEFAQPGRRANFVNINCPYEFDQQARFNVNNECSWLETALWMIKRQLGTHYWQSYPVMELLIFENLINMKFVRNKTTKPIVQILCPWIVLHIFHIKSSCISIAQLHPICGTQSMFWYLIVQDNLSCSRHLTFIYLWLIKRNYQSLFKNEHGLIIYHTIIAIGFMWWIFLVFVFQIYSK